MKSIKTICTTIALSISVSAFGIELTDLKEKVESCSPEIMAHITSQLCGCSMEDAIDVKDSFILLGLNVNPWELKKRDTQGRKKIYEAVEGGDYSMLEELSKSSKEPIVLNLRDLNKSPDTCAKFITTVAIIINQNNHINEVDLASNFLDNYGAEILGKALEVNTSLTHLNLDSNDIGDDGAFFIASALKKNTTLNSLILSFCKIKNPGTKALAEALKVNSSLSLLDLSNNREISEEGLKSMAEALRVNQTLAFLSLNEIRKVSRRDIVLVRSLDSQMDEYGHVKSYGLKALAEALKVNTTLKYLSLISAVINDSEASELAEALKVNRGLKALDLSFNAIRDSGIKAIMEALKTNATLEYLGLFCKVDLEFPTMGAISEVLKTNTTLKYLELNFKFLKDLKRIKVIAEALKVNKTLKYLGFTGNDCRNIFKKALEANKESAIEKPFDASYTLRDFWEESQAVK